MYGKTDQNVQDNSQKLNLTHISTSAKWIYISAGIKTLGLLDPQLEFQNRTYCNLVLHLSMVSAERCVKRGIRLLSRKSMVPLYIIYQKGNQLNEKCLLSGVFRALMVLPITLKNRKCIIICIQMYQPILDLYLLSLSWLQQILHAQF